MSKKIGLAVASALLAAASSANAGIIVPAGDWTLDIGGNVNAYYTSTRQSGAFTKAFGDAAVLGGKNATGNGTESNITTGLLPNFLSVSGKTRENDLDVAFTISINPGASTTASGKQSSQQENRQAFMTFGDKSWGSIKLGKDLGIYASDALLSDMTLLGVGSGAGFLAGNTTTLGRIGTGFVYADWKAQIAYSSPNWNGFSFTGGVTQAWNAQAAGAGAHLTAGTALGNTGAFDSAVSSGRGGASPAFEGKASYEWAGDFAGKVWVSGISQKVKGLSSASGLMTNSVTGAAQAAVANRVTKNSDTAGAWDIGANVNVAGFGLTGYYGQGSGTGTTILLRDGYDQFGNSRDSTDWYVQGTFTVPNVGTKIGVSYGESSLDATDQEKASATGLDDEYKNKMWTVGVYHPLTKHINLVAEYSDVKTKIDTINGKSRTFDVGAIMFF